jgi:hypothetical protein
MQCDNQIIIQFHNSIINNRKRIHHYQAVCM